MNADEESLAMIDDLKTNFRNRDPKRRLRTEALIEIFKEQARLKIKPIQKTDTVEVKRHKLFGNSNSFDGGKVLPSEIISIKPQRKVLDPVILAFQARI